MTNNQEIAGTILSQLGGNRFRAMTGARDFLAIEAGLFFSIPKFPGIKINRVLVKLEASDEYTVSFQRLYNGKLSVIALREGVNAESLRAVFTSETGLETSMGRAN